MAVIKDQIQQLHLQLEAIRHLCEAIGVMLELLTEITNQINKRITE